MLPVYLGVATVLSLGFTALSLKVWRDATDRSAKQMFGFSLFYLSVLFALLIVDRAPMALQG